MLRGQAHAGMMRSCVLENLVRDGHLRPSQVRVLSPRQEPGFDCTLSTRLYPDWPIAVTRETDPALRRARVRQSTPACTVTRTTPYAAAASA